MPNLQCLIKVQIILSLKCLSALTLPLYSYFRLLGILITQCATMPQTVQFKILDFHHKAKNKAT